jgi:hypothetical protein
LLANTESADHPWYWIDEIKLTIGWRRPLKSAAAQPQAVNADVSTTDISHKSDQTQKASQYVLKSSIQSD